MSFTFFYFYFCFKGLRLMLCSVISQRKAAYHKWIRQILRQSRSKEPTIIHGIQIQVKCVVNSNINHNEISFQETILQSMLTHTLCPKSNVTPKVESPTWPNTRNLFFFYTPLINSLKPSPLFFFLNVC